MQNITWRVIKYNEIKKTIWGKIEENDMQDEKVDLNIIEFEKYFKREVINLS